MEAIVRPISWEDWPDASRSLFQAFRSEAGEQLILERNLFVERVLPASVTRKLTDEEMEVYRRPYLNPGESRRPTLTWPRQLPIEGQPADVHQAVADYSAWLEKSQVPKLFVDVEPGFFSPLMRETCLNWPNQKRVTVEGYHFVQEDSPDNIGRSIAGFLAGE